MWFMDANFWRRNRAAEPTSYYGRASGLGLALAALGEKGPIKVGVMGLGTGTIAAYGRPGDLYVFYEINPAGAGHRHELVSISKAQPGAERHCPGRCPPVAGAPAAQNFDLLAVDAFTSNSIPVHLLTREAFAQYWRHLKPGGILAVHVSNLYIDLAPVVARRPGGRQDRAAVHQSTAMTKRRRTVPSWILVAADPAFFQHPAAVTGRCGSDIRLGQTWTDDYSNLWRSLR